MPLDENIEKVLFVNKHKVAMMIKGDQAKEYLSIYTNSINMLRIAVLKVKNVEEKNVKVEILSNNVTKQEEADPPIAIIKVYNNGTATLIAGENFSNYRDNLFEGRKRSNKKTFNIRGKFVKIEIRAIKEAK